MRKLFLTMILFIGSKLNWKTAKTALLRLFNEVSLLVLRRLLELAEVSRKFYVKHRRRFLLVALASTYFIELIFTLFEIDTQVVKKWHPFYDGIEYANGEKWNGWVSDAVFVYGFMEIIARAMIFRIAYVAMRNGIVLRTFYIAVNLEILDMLDYYLFRNGPWFGTFIEFNYIKIGFIFISVLYEWKQSTPYYSRSQGR